MTVPGLPLAEHLPREGRVVLIGGDEVIVAALRRSGVQVTRHVLDTGPLAQPPGVPFTPPVVAWPFPDASFDAVILLDELALTVREEEALAEAARVLCPGGILLLRVPAAGPLAWLDGFNAYRYLRETTRRGGPLPEVEGVGWRRHYPPNDLRQMLRPHFQVWAMRGAGLGLADAVRLVLLVYWRWVRRSEAQHDLIRDLPQAVTRYEGKASLRGWGYSLVVVAERA